MHHLIWNWIAQDIVARVTSHVHVAQSLNWGIDGYDHYFLSEDRHVDVCYTNNGVASKNMGQHGDVQGSGVKDITSMFKKRCAELAFDKI